LIVYGKFGRRRLRPFIEAGSSM